METSQNILLYMCNFSFKEFFNTTRNWLSFRLYHTWIYQNIGMNIVACLKIVITSPISGRISDRKLQNWINIKTWIFDKERILQSENRSSNRFHGVVDLKATLSIRRSKTSIRFKPARSKRFYKIVSWGIHFQYFCLSNEKVLKIGFLVILAFNFYRFV